MRNAANKIKRPAIDEGMGKEHKKPHEVSCYGSALRQSQEAGTIMRSREFT